MRALLKTSRFLTPYKGLILGTFITVILPVAMELVVPRLMQDVIDKGIMQSDMREVWRGSAFMFAAAVIGAVATFGQGIFRARLSQNLAYDMRRTLFRKVMTLSHAEVDQLRTGQLITRLTSDVDTVRMFASVGVSLMLRAVLMMAGSLVLITQSDVQLSAVGWIILCLTVAFMRWGLAKTTPMFRRVQRKLSALNVTLQENLAGMSEVRAFVQEQAQIGKFSAANDSLVDENIKVGKLIAVALPLIALLTNLGLVAMTWFGGASVISDRITLGQLVAFNSYLMIGLSPMLMLAGMMAMMSRAVASSQRVWEVLTLEPLLKDRPEAVSPPAEGRIVFEDVEFAYSRRTGLGVPVNGAGPREEEEELPIGGRRLGEPVLEELSFEIEPGQTIGIIGATGSGKSSLLHLIPRFYDSSAGRVSIDGVDVKDWPLRELRRAVGLVAQHPSLFNRSIRDNIAFGRPELSDEQARTAARMAQAQDFIEAEADGYDYLVEEGGANLSGGQKQRISIARALAVDPTILLLDDATSSVDLETEAEIQAAFREVSRGRTTIIVAHRISSIQHADRILILEEGRVVSDGTHAELLESSSIYRDLCATQVV